MTFRISVLSGIAAGIFCLQPMLTAQSTPEEAVVSYQTALKKGDTGSLMKLLPPSYLSDSTALLNDFGNRMDEEVWSKLRELLGQASGALEPKAGLLVEVFQGAESQSSVQRELQTRALQATLRSVGNLAQSDVLNLEQLRKADVSSLISDLVPMISATTAALQADPATGSATAVEDMLKIVKSETLPNGNTAVTFAGADEEAGDPVEFTKVEDRWIPVEIADNWSGTMRNARASISKFDFSSPKGKQQKAQVLMALGMLGPMVQQLASAESAEQLQQMAGGLLLPLMMMGTGMESGMPGGAIAPPVFPGAQ